MIKSLRSNILRLFEFINSARGEAVRYIFIGGCTTLLDYLTYHLLLKGVHCSVTISNLISTILAILFAYAANKLYVFKSRTHSVSEFVCEFLRFIGARLFTMVIEIGGVYLLVNTLKQDELLGKAEVIVLVIILNYFLSKLIVFRKKRMT